MRSLTKVCPILVLASSLASAQSDASFIRPAMGFVFDSAERKILPITGTPGAALVTSGIALPFELSRALVSSRSGYALVSEPASDGIHLVRNLGSEPVAAIIPGSLKSFDIGALSHSSKSAIVYAADCRCVQIIAGLPDDPRVSRTLTLPDETAALRSLAVSDDGSLFAIGEQSQTEEARGRLSVYLPAGNDPRTFPVSPSALAFSPDGKTLAIADADHRNLSIVRDVAGAAELTELASERDGMRQPIALAFTSESRLAVADSDAGVHIVDTETRRLTVAECSCGPSTIERTVSDDIFRLTGSEAGAVWMLQFLDEGIRVFFVPIHRGEENAK